MTRDQSVTTLRLAPDSHLVLIVDVDPAGLDLAGRRLLAAVREAVGAWEANERRCEASGVAPGPITPPRPPEAPQQRTSTRERPPLSVARDGPRRP